MGREGELLDDLSDVQVFHASLLQFPQTPGLGPHRVHVLHHLFDVIDAVAPGLLSDLRLEAVSGLVVLVRGGLERWPDIHRSAPVKA